MAAAVVCFAQVAGIDALASPARRLLAAAFACFAAVPIYLLDRVKLRDSLLDPADAAAHPRRFAFLARRTHAVRWLLAMILVLSMTTGFALAPWAAALPLLAVGGVLLYAGRPRRLRGRPKDLFLIKNAYVAAGITGFAALVALAAGAGSAASLASLRGLLDAHAAALAFSAAHLLARIVADAALCDLDDEHADRAHGTSTLPTHLGRTRAWNISMLVRLLLGAALVLIPIGPARARAAWAIVTVVSSLTLRAWSPSRVRDWVDIRFALEALAATLLMACS